MVRAKGFFYEYAMIAAGTFLLALGLTLFLSRSELVVGGVTGFGIALSGITERFGVRIPLWITNTAINIPLLFIGLKVKGLKFLKKTLFATLFLSASLIVTELIPPISGIDMLLASIFGGVLCGAGVGLVFRFEGTTGGSDLAASIIHKFKPHMSISKLLFGVDAVIVAMGLFVFGPTNTLYAIISIFISTQVIDAVLEGLSFSKATFIISDHADEISKAIIKELDRSATILDGRGAYSGNVKNVVLCVVSQKEVFKLKNLASAIDRNAFIIVSDVREVLGEGFSAIEGK